MKKYIAPKLVCVDLRAEERVCDCKYETGACTDDEGNLVGFWTGLQS